MTRNLKREDMTWLEQRHAQRYGLGPYYVGVVVLAAGHLTWPLAGAWQSTLAIAVMTFVAFCWVVTRVSGWNRLLYGLLVLGMSVTWIWWLHQPAPEPGLLPGIREWANKIFWFVIALHVMGVGWWTAKFKGTQVHLEDDLRGWSEIAGNFGLGMTSRHIEKRSENGNESGFLVWPRGSTTVKHVMDRREELEAAMGLPEGTLRLMKHPDGKRNATDRVDYVSFLDDPLSEAVEWPGPQQAPDGGDLSVDVPAAVGIQEDGEIAYVPYYERDINAVVNKLFGGSQGSGKSGGFQLHIMDIACRSDGTQWGFDLKDGMEIAPFDAIMDNLACNAEEATEAINALDAIMTYRGEENTRRGRKAWPVDPEHPLLFVWIDELHRLLAAQNGREARDMRKCEEVLVRLATTGRALGMSVNGATQNPTLEATRTSQFRDRLNQRICFRTESSSHEGYIIPGRKVDAHLIPSSMPGMCYVQDRDRFTGLPIRYYRVTDEMVEMVMEVRAPGLPLDEGSQRAAMAVSPRYAERCRVRYDENPEDGEAMPFDPDDPDGPDGPRPVTDITPMPIPDLDLSGPDLTLSAIRAAHARLSGQGAAQAVAVMPEPEPMVAQASSEPETFPIGEPAVFLVLKKAGRRGATAKQLYEAAERKKSWFYLNVGGWLEEGRLVQPGGPNSAYYLPEFAPDM
jgi:S-DNA-T family DNA segregation ATPase FtsK/SpoIIIE